ncbi:hypothetical protein [Dactylosporangium sp. CA-233914]|uniref:hypothetical protein n=1 Tax=Dactylosporangium sp. CA-233914 TaxID=3239934 RepID=UPI003D8DE9E1
MQDGPGWIGDGLSWQRFRPYLAKVNGDLVKAIQWYQWNVEISAAFYGSLHFLEVPLRNAVHRRLSAQFGRDDWWVVAPLDQAGRRIVDDALRKLASRSRGSMPDDMVAELSFGFWVSLVSSKYHRDLWVSGLHRAFPSYRGPRRRLHSELQTMLLFRNRVMHHEPIHHRHLEADHATILRVVGYMSTDMAHQLKSFDQVPVVLGRRPAA